eukprot:4119119-Ditylum_brightwellii.AAC.1
MVECSKCSCGTSYILWHSRPADGILCNCIQTSPEKNTTGNKENTSFVAPDERQRYSKPEIKARKAY